LQYAPTNNVDKSFSFPLFAQQTNLIPPLAGQEGSHYEKNSIWSALTMSMLDSDPEGSHYETGNPTLP